MKFPTKKYNYPKEYFKDYIYNFSNILDSNHYKELEKITNYLNLKIKAKKNIFICGNGGSAAIANHFLCDFNKGIKISSKSKLVPRVISLSNSIELITAISNDINFSEIYKFQLENLASANDTLIIFSSSGKSKNIVNAIKYARKNKIDVISFIGFKHQRIIKNYSKFYLNLNILNYGISEDIFQAIMHMISQFLRQKNGMFKKENY